MAKKDGKALRLFERICVQLIFLLSAFLILFLGIRAAGSTIDFAQSERIEIINNLVEGLSEGDRIANQSKNACASFWRSGRSVPPQAHANSTMSPTPGRLNKSSAPR